MNTIFDNAEKYFNAGDFKTSFGLFKNIGENKSYNIEERAEAYNMMGVIVLIDPENDPENESGLIYFAKSVKINPNNIGALHNIIENFGLSPNNHTDTDLLLFSINQLKAIVSQLSEYEQNMIGGKIKLIQGIDNV